VPERRRDDDVGAYASDKGMVVVGNVEAAVGADGKAIGVGECGPGGRAAVPAEANGSIARRRRDDTVQPYSADPHIECVREINSSVRARCDGRWIIELRLCSRAAVATKGTGADASNRRDDLAERLAA